MSEPDKSNTPETIEETLSGLTDEITRWYEKEAYKWKINGKILEITPNALDDTVKIIVEENEKKLTCELNSISQYTPKELHNFWRRQKNNVNEKIICKIPEKGTNAEKLLQLFEENDNILYAKDTRSFDLINPDRFRFVLTDFFSEDIKNLPQDFKNDLVAANKRYNVFSTQGSRDAPNDWNALYGWHWQSLNPYAPKLETYHYSETKEEAVRRYLETNSSTSVLLKALVEAAYQPNHY